MLRTRRLPPSLFLAALLATILVVWLAETEQNLRESSTPIVPPEEADYYMENFHLSETDSDGRILRQLSGDRLAHYTNDHTDLQAPKLTLNEDQQPGWRITADKGQLKQSQQLELQYHIHILQLNAPADERLLVKTQNLTIDMQSRESHSEGLVEISQANATIQAQGMRLLFDERQLQLQSQVRGNYVQP